MKRLLLLLMLVTTLPLVAGTTADRTTLRQQMDLLQRERGIIFIYDASLPLGQAYTGPALHTLTLKKALAQLFANTGIDYKLQGHQVLLFKGHAERPRQTTYTLSGHVRDSIGETLINATVRDLTTGAATMTNQYGYYSLTLPEGDHQLRVSYTGFEEQNQQVSLHASHTQDFRLVESRLLREVVVTGDLNSPISGTQMGKYSLSQADIKTEFSLMSSPDVVKTLQRLSGVQEGVELASGMYVHGGNNDENLFLIDGTPLYQVNHTMGLFSAFNTDVVKNVDFYKSGFPARYGGRLSSVVDVRTNDGDMWNWHGAYRIGMLDGSFQIEGPLKAGRTSLNIGLRRSWLDLLTEPAFAIYGMNSTEEKINVNYNFHDLNAKLTHVVNDRQRISLSIYSGRDALSTKYDANWHTGEGSGYDTELTKNRFRWGNFNAALDWNCRINPKLMSNVTAVYTHNRANFFSYDDWRYAASSDDDGSVSHNEHSSRSTIYDAGYRTEFDYRPTPRHHVRFGHDYTLHLFRPQTRRLTSFAGSSSQSDTIANESHNRQTAHEMTFYAEDQLTLTDRWSLNGGLNLSLFAIQGKTYCDLNPRVAVKYQLLPNVSVKASYTMMTQFVHKITNSILELPTDYWVPTTRRLKPMRSQQVAAGIYSQWGRRWSLSLEGYYKRSSHLLQYNSWTGLEPPAASWDQEVTDGEGRFYGMEADAQYRTPRVTLTAAYTLSWNDRRFATYYDQWYPDKFDNRHKLNLTGRIKLGPRTEAYAAWIYHTGNHTTIPTQYVKMGKLPGGYDLTKSNNGYSFDYLWDNGKGSLAEGFIYERPNNITLPAYHRLDVGFNFHKTTRKGHERTWNISLYNAYCHLNAMWTDVGLDREGRLRVKVRGFIPIIPSCSYSIKF